MRWSLALVIALVALPLLTAAALVAAGQAGLLAGRPPAGLGVRDGRLKAPSATENSVSSQADLWPGLPHRDRARIAPLPLAGSGAQTLQRLRAIVESMPGATVEVAGDDYLRASFRSRWLGFVDDLELWHDAEAGVVHVRSASRVGRRDFGVNRARVEAIRARLAQG